MRRGAAVLLAAGCGLLVCTLFAQRPFREYPAWEYYNFPLPSDYQVPGEWTFARLMYPTTRYQLDWQSERMRGFDWREGSTNWTIDYPRSDRHLAMAIRRLTRIQARSVEQPINLELDDDAFNYPWLYAVETGHWELTDSMVTKFREFLLRGGFFMCDDFHGSDEWTIFTMVMKKVFPDRPLVDIPNPDAIFHNVYDLNERYQVPGAQYISTHMPYEKDGVGGRWAGMYDDHGRLMVLACHNNDLGDSWEHADDPRYPQQFSALGIRVGVNSVVYGLTH